ncbi:hypothetical protein ACHAWF_002865 [Thalassiosira exigua]
MERRRSDERVKARGGRKSHTGAERSRHSHSPNTKPTRPTIPRTKSVRHGREKRTRGPHFARRTGISQAPTTIDRRRPERPTMPLSVDASSAASGSSRGGGDENESPLGKRKSDLISPSSRRTSSSYSGFGARGPLSDLNSTVARDSCGGGAKGASLSKKSNHAGGGGGRGGPSTPPLRASLAPSQFDSAAKLFDPSRRFVRKEAVEATDDGRASVNQLSSWLATESAKKKKHAKDANARRYRPPVPSRSAGAPPPISFASKPRMKKEDVQAGDDKRASVKTLSSWMSNDPFAQRKVRTVRTGSHVILKSRAFEKDQESLARRECDIRAGRVGERQAWLSEAFKHEGEDVPRPLREEKVRPYRQQTREGGPAKELKSVRDKKEWLSNAFKGKDEGANNAPAMGTARSFEAKSHSGDGAERDMSGRIPVVGPARSFEVKLHSNDCSGECAHVRQAKSFDARDDGNISSVSEENAIPPARSFDGAKSSALSKAFERQRSVVRLYRDDGGEEPAESPTRALKTVHDKQAWLSGAFAKSKSNVETREGGPSMATSRREAGAEDAPSTAGAVAPVKAAVRVGKGGENVSVADRARWLRGAFHHE